MFVDTPPTLEL